MHQLPIVTIDINWIYALLVMSVCLVDVVRSLIANKRLVGVCINC